MEEDDVAAEIFRDGLWRRHCRGLIRMWYRGRHAASYLFVVFAELRFSILFVILNGFARVGYDLIVLFTSVLIEPFSLRHTVRLGSFGLKSIQSREPLHRIERPRSRHCETNDLIRTGWHTDKPAE